MTVPFYSIYLAIQHSPKWEFTKLLLFFFSWDKICDKSKVFSTILIVLIFFFPPINFTYVSKLYFVRKMGMVKAKKTPKDNNRQRFYQKLLKKVWNSPYPYSGYKFTGLPLEISLGWAVSLLVITIFIRIYISPEDFNCLGSP